MFTKEDFPTFERPMKATSGSFVFGQSSTLTTDDMNSACLIVAAFACFASSNSVNPNSSSSSSSMTSSNPPSMITSSLSVSSLARTITRAPFATSLYIILILLLLLLLLLILLLYPFLLCGSFCADADVLFLLIKRVTLL